MTENHPGLPSFLIKKEKDLKRKAESPNLVLELRTSKRTKILPSKALQRLLVNRDNLADHIQINYSHEIKTDFYKPALELTTVESEREEGKHILPLTLQSFVSREPEDKSEYSQLLKALNSNFPFYKFKTYSSDNLDLKYAVIFPFQIAYHVMERLENEVEYMSSKEAKVKLFGRWFEVPRKQVAFGEPGLSYTFSGKTVSAREWTPLMSDLLSIVNQVTTQQFNFVLVNRYKDGRDHIGEHRDDEDDLDPSAPIASLSFGAARDFVLRHKDLRKKKSKCSIAPVTIVLEPGSLLLMNPPTNDYWYHSLPIRKDCCRPRVNLTFRKIIKVAKNGK